MIVPEGVGSCRAVAFAHGSGYVSADSPFDLYHTVRMARECGLSVLRWDKRGVGGSGGDQGVATYHDLAEDVLAGVEWLRAQDAVQFGAVGVGGISQAPSVPLPIAAVEAPGSIDFVIAVSGFVGTIREANLFNWTNRLRKKGYVEDDIRRVLVFYGGLFPLTRDPTPEGQRRYDAYLERFEHEQWYGDIKDLTGIDTPLDSPVLERWRAICDVDSGALWRRVECPVFMAWGADDPLVDVEQSHARAQQIMRSCDTVQISPVVYPSPAAHGVGQASTPTYFEDLKEWLDQEFGVAE